MVGLEQSRAYIPVRLRRRVEESPTFIFRRHPVAFLLTLKLETVLVLILPLGYGLWYFGCRSLRIWLAWCGLLFGWAFFLIYRWLDWRNDIFFISHRSVGHLERRLGRAYQHQVVAGLGQVQDVVYVKEGWAAYLFDFGTIIIRTAGRPGRIEFQDVGRPWLVAEILFDRVRKWHRASSTKGRY